MAGAKKKGKMNMTPPKRTAVAATFIGEVWAIAAAGNAHSATGGVILQSIPQYSTKRCTASLSSPVKTRAGAITMAKKI